MLLIEGNVLLDQSMLTGESLPVEAGANAQTYAGASTRVPAEQWLRRHLRSVAQVHQVQAGDMRYAGIIRSARKRLFPRSPSVAA